MTTPIASDGAPVAPPTLGASTAALRAAVRPWLKTVIRRPGGLYQPLYFGPVPTADFIEAEVQSLADVDGVPTYFGAQAGLAQRSALGNRPSVVVVSAAEAPEVLAAQVPGRPSAQQVIIWGRTSVDALPDDVRAWVQAGLAVDPTACVRPETGAEWSMGPILRRCARDPGRVYNPILLIAPQAQQPYVTTEATLRLEAAGFAVVQSVPATVRADDPAVARLGKLSAVVVDLSSGLPVDIGGRTLREAINTFIMRGAQVVLVGDAAVQAATEADAAWAAVLEPGVSLVVASEMRESADAARLEALERQAAWPPLAEVLVGGPVAVPEPPRIMTGRASADGSATSVSLGSTIQMIAMQRMTGRLAVYTPDRLGTIDFDNGQIIHAAYLGDRWALQALGDFRNIGLDGIGLDPSELAYLLVRDRACRIGSWADTYFVFFAPPTLIMPPGERTAVSPEEVILEIARRVDDNPRRDKRVGGLDRIWQKAGDPPSPSETPAHVQRLYGALDGKRPLVELARVLGLLDDEALDAIHVLQTGRHAAAMGSVRLADDRPSVVAVATALLGSGLQREATALLEAAAADKSLPPAAATLLAHLYASTDPQAASVQFQSALRDDTPSALALDLQCNLALLAVRGRQMPPLVVWRHLAAALQSAGAAGLPSVRHYAICAELALRAGDYENAERALQGVRAFAGPEAEGLTESLGAITAAARGE